jgi:ssDNA-binding Zn-finger/Zn-ribbon topoisomerase 1
MFLKFLDSILPGSGAIVKTAVRAVQRGVASFVQSLREDWARVTSAQGRSSRPSDEIRHDIKETDGEITDLERKLRRDGQLSGSEEDRLKELRQEAMDLAEEHQQARSEETTSEILSETSEATATSLSQEYLHILDWSRGPAVRMKRCPKCSAPMYLNRRNQPNREIFTMRDYFWACTNFYIPEGTPGRCNGTMSFSEQDFGLLHKAGIPELEITRDEFILITSQKPALKVIEKKMGQVLGAQDIDVNCPIHGLPLVLQEKQTAEEGNILDYYYLKCPHIGCCQTRKLKDAAQLASFLKRVTGEGILP